MAVRKLTTGKWLCECYPAGRSVRRVRKQFATKGEALAFERHTMEETEAKPWLGESVDRRTLKDVVELWFKLHGKSLTAGQHVYDKLLLMVDALGNPLATDLTSKMFAHYRDKRLTGCENIMPHELRVTTKDEEVGQGAQVVVLHFVKALIALNAAVPNGGRIMPQVLWQ